MSTESWRWSLAALLVGISLGVVALEARRGTRTPDLLMRLALLAFPGLAVGLLHLPWMQLGPWLFGGAMALLLWERLAPLAGPLPARLKTLHLQGDLLMLGLMLAGLALSLVALAVIPREACAFCVRDLRL